MEQIKSTSLDKSLLITPTEDSGAQSDGEEQTSCQQRQKGSWTQEEMINFDFLIFELKAVS